jgi:hypothetical protein
MKNEISIDEKAILIRINQLYHESMTSEELYEATRGVWKVGIRRDEAEYAFTVFRGEIKEVYKIDSWLPAGTFRYKTRSRADVEVAGRWEFVGSLAEDKIRNKYIGRTVKNYLAQGMVNPIVYINC